MTPRFQLKKDSSKYLPKASKKKRYLQPVPPDLEPALFPHYTMLILRKGQNMYNLTKSLKSMQLILSSYI